MCWSYFIEVYACVLIAEVCFLLNIIGANHIQVSSSDLPGSLSMPLFPSLWVTLVVPSRNTRNEELGVLWKKNSSLFRFFTCLDSDTDFVCSGLSLTPLPLRGIHPMILTLLFTRNWAEARLSEISSQFLIWTPSNSCFYQQYHVQKNSWNQNPVSVGEGRPIVGSQVSCRASLDPK